jgi:hypothetical protein
VALEALESRQLPSTLTVTSAADDGPGTLRQTIAVAESGDTIQFSPDLGRGIGLTSGELQITRSLNIQGPGVGNLGIGSTARVFDITTPGAVVTMASSGPAATAARAWAAGSRSSWAPRPTSPTARSRATRP